MKRTFATLLALLMITSLCSWCSAESYPDAAAFVADIPTTQYFTEDAVADEDIEKILMAGINAPSAMNGQPWHFAAITDSAVIEEIASGMSFGGPASFGAGSPPSGAEAPEGMELPEGQELPEGFDGAEKGELPEGMSKPSMPAGSASTKAGLTDAPLVIVISCNEGSELDAGLACQNMYVEAQLLGYGAKIISSPTMALNGDRKAEFSEMLGIPEGQSAVAILLVGVEDTTVDTTADTYSGATERNPMDDVVTFVKP